MYEIIKEAAESLNNGDSTRIFCPFCGDSSEKTMSVTREVATVLYHCYRAGCAKSGVIGASVSRTKRKKEFKPKIFSKTTIPAISNMTPSAYLDHYEISTGSMLYENIGWLPEERRIVFPLFNWGGYKWGTLTKTVDPGVKPKTILYQEVDGPVIHFPMGCDENQILILVEDVISAIKISEYNPCAAILGTHISEDMVMYLKGLPFKEIRIMFDSDATSKALGYVKKYKGILNLSVLEVSKPYSDPKDIPRSQLEEMFR